MKKIAMASDHAGYEMKEHIKNYLLEKGYEITDFGTDSDASCDYADYGHEAARAIEQGVCDCGVCFCGSGEGMAMTLNKHRGIRAGLCWCVEVARLIRQHNNANAVVMPGRFITMAEAEAITDAFLNTDFEGGRQQRRIEKLACD